jgi:hypothetical protein
MAGGLPMTRKLRYCLLPLITAGCLLFGVGRPADPVLAASADDACTLLTPAEISAALGEPSGPCEYISPSSKATSVWHMKSGKAWVTLSHLTPQGFEGAKAMFAANVTAVHGVGDDAYYLAMGNQVGLGVKKGNVYFKVAVYDPIPLDKKEAMEKALALNALAKL